MADDGSSERATWPLPKFSFRVQWGAREAVFQEVSGLDTEARPIEYRAGNNPVFASIKMPTLRKSGNVTMKRGVFAKDNALFALFSGIKMNVIERQTVTISLLDENANPAMVWKLKNALPTYVTGADLKSDDGKVAVESVVFAHEGLEIETT